MRTKYIITSDCRFNRKLLTKGTILELDREDPVEGQQIAELYLAGRIGDATKANCDAIGAEIKFDQERERKLAQDEADRLLERKAYLAGLKKLVGVPA
jgi:hypothetical protein